MFCLLHGYLILIFVPSSMFAPSVEEYPHLASLICNAGEKGVPAEAGQLEHKVGPNKDAACRPISMMWQQLKSVQDNINHWTYVAEDENLPTTIWDLLRQHISAETVDTFIGILEEGIRDGYAHIQGLMNFMPNSMESGLDLKDWSDEVAHLFFIVRRAMARLQIALDLVRTGLVYKYPSILQPKVTSLFY
jgi:hypothetical protein